MTLSAERKLGDRIARELYRDPDYLEDPILDEYLQNIWQPLVKGAQARGDMSPELQERFAWKILIGRDRSVNAFALPGGYLGIHLGLISVVTTRDELASVMAHELSHVAANVAFGSSVSIRRVEFHGIPFFAVAHPPSVTRRQEYVISSAGFWSQHASSERLLTRRFHF